LPLVTPEQIQISRKIKYLFTGNLSKDILTNPDFPGKEAHLLKCQLVRINTTCTIVPKGMFVQNAEDPK
jgi:radial spoke head protein 4A